MRDFERDFELIAHRKTNGYAESLRHRDADDFIDRNDYVLGVSGSRYYWLNLTNRKTIEIRLNAGSIYAERVTHLIKLYYYLFEACRKLSANEFSIDNVLKYINDNANDTINYIYSQEAFKEQIEALKASNNNEVAVCV